MKQIFFLLVMCMTILSAVNIAAAQGKKILYVPIDSRPCNLYQVLQVTSKLDYEVLTPPIELLGSRVNRGDVEGIWKWVRENAPLADYAVLSTDSLLYGSLVASRVHTLEASTIMERARRFKTLHEDFPYLTIYAIGTIMRTPHYNFKGEVPYYETHGEKIFQYTALIDKEEMGLLTSEDKRKYKKLEAEIPSEYLDDWFKRRARNSDANELFIEYTRAGVFDYFLLGCDDSAKFSQTHRESRRLTELGSDMGKTVTQVTSGADELGMLMIARAINIDTHSRPFISVAYNEGEGGKTFPAYCNEPINISVDAAIIAAGGMKIPAHERADLVLAVNTRYNGKTFEAAHANRNHNKFRRDLKPFMKMVNNFMDKGYPVAIADIAFSNGADNALMTQLKRNDLQYKIRAYGGWNTATNSSGFLIGAGMLTPLMNDKDVAELLTTRYLDDWIYQSNVRQEMQSAIWAIGGNPQEIGDKINQVNEILSDKMKDFAAQNLNVPSRWRMENFKTYLPWQRLFECDPRFTLSD
ncbi:MAG: DUF4127 family protein [Selenomonadaceae bacterium]|nr:DUF4127 family protein [Selenomonadaceae bacterium]